MPFSVMALPQNIVLVRANILQFDCSNLQCLPCLNVLCQSRLSSGPIHTSTPPGIEPFHRNSLYSISETQCSILLSLPSFFPLYHYCRENGIIQVEQFL